LSAPTGGPDAPPAAVSAGRPGEVGRVTSPAARRSNQALLQPAEPEISGPQRPPPRPAGPSGWVGPPSQDLSEGTSRERSTTPSKNAEEEGTAPRDRTYGSPDLTCSPKPPYGAGPYNQDYIAVKWAQVKGVFRIFRHPRVVRGAPCMAARAAGPATSCWRIFLSGLPPAYVYRGREEDFSVRGVFPAGPCPPAGRCRPTPAAVN
jgi:hypothetical protein